LTGFAEGAFGAMPRAGFGAETGAVLGAAAI
jgi:hypothetical protein